MKNSVRQIIPATDEWEAICAGCARCCYEKIDYRGQIFYTDKPCKHLDIRSRRCQVYADRDRVCPDCASLTPELVAAGILPADCPYVQTLAEPGSPETSAD